jgi:hypothetical protein
MMAAIPTFFGLVEMRHPQLLDPGVVDFQGDTDILVGLLESKAGIRLVQVARKMKLGHRIDTQCFVEGVDLAVFRRKHSVAGKPHAGHGWCLEKPAVFLHLRKSVVGRIARILFSGAEGFGRGGQLLVPASAYAWLKHFIQLFLG